MKERLELRAQKFGVALWGEAIKQARAERFDMTASNDTKKDVTAISVTVAPNVDTLKKRAERFGGSVSTVMNKLENQEKLLKRQERFGLVSAPVNTTSSSVTASATPTTNEYSEKAKLRLERFKTAVK